MLALFAFVAGCRPPVWSARWRSTPLRTELEVRHGRSTWVIPPFDADVDGARHWIEVPRSGFRFGRFRLVPSGGGIVDRATGRRLALPHPLPPPFGWKLYKFTCKGAVQSGNRMFWLFAWDVTGSIRPSSSTWAYEVGMRGSDLVLLRSTAVPGLDGYNLATAGFKKGSDLLLVTSDDRFVAFDLNHWMAFSGANDCHSSPSGIVYRLTPRNVGETVPRPIFEWQATARRWVELRKTGSDVLTAVTTLGGDDLLVFRDGLLLARSGRAFSFSTSPDHRVLCVDAKVGVGFGNLFLDTTLKPRCPIAAAVKDRAGK